MFHKLFLTYLDSSVEIRLQYLRSSIPVIDKPLKDICTQGLPVPLCNQTFCKIYKKNRINKKPIPNKSSKSSIITSNRFNISHKLPNKIINNIPIKQTKVFNQAQSFHKVSNIKTIIQLCIMVMLKLETLCF